MEIQVAFDTSGAAAAGVDRESLIADLQAELDKLAARAEAPTPKPDKKPPPEGAQGDAAIIHWLLHVAADPAMAKVYAQGLLMAINSILTAAQNRETESSPPSGDQEPAKKPKPVTVKLLGQQIALPVATAVIKAFLDQLQSH